MKEELLEGFRLSPQQKRLWLSQHNRPANLVYCAVLVEGPLDPEILKQAAQNIVDRHEILRTRFASTPGIKLPFQVVADRIRPLWEGYDWTELEPSQLDSELDRLFQDQCSALDIPDSSLPRFSLIALSGNKHVMVLSLSPLCSDSMTLDNLAREFSNSYEACLNDAEQAGDILQYADYCAWLEGTIDNQDEDVLSGISYWRKQNQVPSITFRLPFQSRGSQDKRGTLGSFVSMLGADIVPALDRAAQQYGVSLSDYLCACWSVLLWRLGGQQEIVSAVEFPGRSDKELREALGLFAQWLPVRFQFSEAMPFSGILAQVSAVLRETEIWQDYSAEDLIEPHPMGIGFGYEERPQKERAGGVSFSVIKKRNSTRTFDLEFRCVRADDSLAAHFYYDPDLFASEDIERLAGQFHTLLEGAIQHAETGIGQLEILSQPEREQILINFNDTENGIRQGGGAPCEGVHERFQQQAAARADSLAVVYEDLQWTYGELEIRANQLARHLQSLGVGPGTLTAIYVERSLDMVLALLGVLKAGGAYVPLDTGLPKERLSVILNDTRAAVVLTHRGAAERLPEYDGHVVNLDTDWPVIGECDAGRLKVNGATSANLAYVLFTSGSTGTPKGVAIEHRQLLNYVDAILERLNLPAGASYACVSTFAADLGNTAIFPALCSGGSLHLISQDRASDPDALGQYFSQHSIDCLKIVPSHLEALMTASSPESVLPKRRLVLGGEAASWDLLKKIEQLAPNCLVLNHYGPTEATVGATTCYASGDQMDSRVLSVPIGKPLANVKTYLLNSYLQPVPIWVAGELYIGGAGVARGYLNRPDLTAERFIPSPFASGARLYRTGDLGRYLPDGRIEFLGRTDYQIKIRGFRVELGEIEAVLRQNTNVQHAVVTVREDLPSQKKIVAYIVTSRGKVENPTDLRDFLRTRLPDYMVPAAFVMLDALPLTSNGKVDRTRLPEPALSEAKIEKRSAALLKPLEVVIAGIFSEVLHTPHVDINGNFFDLGGHSLLAIQVLSRIRRLLNIDLPLRSLFEKPTVAGMAAAILTDPMNAARIERTAQQVLKDPHESQPITPRQGRDFVPLSSTQEQMWFIDQLSPGSASYNMAQAFHLEGPLHLSALDRSLKEIVRRHESLRTTFVSIDGVPQQVITPSMTVTLPVVELSNIPIREKADEAVRLATEEARQPFDLEKGPLLRFKVLRLGRQEHTLLIGMHHIISDGWSWGVFLKEFSVLYEAFSEEKESPLSELTIQYADFAQWQRERLKGDVLEDRLSYWTRRLENASTFLELPTDRPRRAVQAFQGATHYEMFPKALKEKLAILGREESATLFMALCAAFNVLLFRWTGQDDIAVGSTFAGRDQAELEPLIGLFINTLVLRTNLSGNPTFRDLLRQVREVALGAYANQEVPFDKLMEGLHSKRTLSHGTLFQVLFILHQGTSAHDLALSGLKVTRTSVDMGMVKFPLSVSMVEKADGLGCSFTYQTDLFDPPTIRRMVVQFQTLLYRIVADPDAHLSELPVLSDAERLETVVAWNNTEKDFPRGKCVHDLFQEQVSRTPDATAAVFEDERVTYRELDLKANHLAGHLQELGVRCGALVVVCMDRSLDMIVAVLSVLKAGGAYVPLDPKYSIERLDWVLRDTGASVLVTNRRVAATFPGALASHNVEIVCLDDTSSIGSGNRPKQRDVQSTPEHLAYVIYTSGSTGTPKGVEITHRSLVNFAVSSAAEFDLQASDRVLQFASLSFDTAVEEIFPCLIHGATLVLRTDRMLDSASVFLEQCRQWQITILDLPTVYWHELTENIASEHLALPELLRLVVLGGDKALPERVAQWQTCSRGRVRLLNEYGPTEATVVATLHELGGFPPANGSAHEVPIGRPIANVQTYLLDRDLNPVPIGVSGELYIGGVGLAVAYHGRPDLTAASFIPNPFSNEGERLYKTGDLARYLPDGTIDFLGRLDHQTKIRGFRVEPAEVEVVLRESAAVRQVVVVAGLDRSGDNRLVAYVVLAPGFETAAEELRSFLKARLPEYMLPSAFVFLDALPLTASGKVDRHALPQPEENRTEAKHVVIPARTPLEQQLIDEWERLLSTRPIGIRDNFFDLGGHSLLGVRLIARIEKRFGKSLPVAVLFESPTIEQLASLLERKNFPQSWSSLIPVQTKGSKLPFFWVHGDSSNAVLPAYLGADQPLYGLEHQSQDGKTARYTSVSEIAKHYLSEVRSVCPCGPYLVGGYSFGAVVAFEMAQQLIREGEQVPLLFMLDPPGKDQTQKSRPVSEEARRYLRKIALLGYRQTLRHFWITIEDQLQNQIGAKITKPLRRLRLRYYISANRLLPPALRSPYILGIYRLALQSYVPQRYSGRVSLVRTEGSYRPRLDWSRLSAGDLSTYELHGGHMDLRTEPYVREWAGHLKESLDRAYEFSRPANSLTPRSFPYFSDRM